MHCFGQLDFDPLHLFAAHQVFKLHTRHNTNRSNNTDHQREVHVDLVMWSACGPGHHAIWSKGVDMKTFPDWCIKSIQRAHATGKAVICPDLFVQNNRLSSKQGYLLDLENLFSVPLYMWEQIRGYVYISYVWIHTYKLPYQHTCTCTHIYITDMHK